MTITLGSRLPASLTVGTHRTTGEFPLAQSTYTANGVWIAPGALDRWFTARAASATTLVEVCYCGDSTMAGETADPFYSPVTRVRELLGLDGYTDGGHGNLNGPNDIASVAGSAEGLVAGQGFASQNVYVLPGESYYGDVAGDNETMTRIGRYLTLYYSRLNTGGRFTYEIDNSGTEVPVDPAMPNTGTVYTFARTGVIDLGSDGSHTIKIRNKGGRIVNAPSYSGGSFTGSSSGGSLTAGTYDYATAFLTSGGKIGPMGPTRTVTITAGQTFNFVLTGQANSIGTTTNFYRRVSGVGSFKLIGSVSTSNESPYALEDTGLSATTTYAEDTAPVLNPDMTWVNVTSVVTRAVGIVLHNYAARGSSTGMVANPYNLAIFLGLDLEPLPTVAATDRAIDTTPGARRPVLTVLGHGINDQQQDSGDHSALTKSNTITAIQAARYAGSDALVLIPAFETANQSQNASLYRTALKEAAQEQNAAWIDIGDGGALPGVTVGPHLSAAQYATQGDFEYVVLGAR